VRVLDERAGYGHTRDTGLQADPRLAEAVAERRVHPRCAERTQEVLVEAAPRRPVEVRRGGFKPASDRSHLDSPHERICARTIPEDDGLAGDGKGLHEHSAVRSEPPAMDGASVDAEHEDRLRRAVGLHDRHELRPEWIGARNVLLRHPENLPGSPRAVNRRVRSPPS
jgi:hypothetical protein